MVIVMDLDNKYGVLEAQQQLLSLLKVFHSFCVNTGILYSLAYGSLLGAIRHNGFIPWDDDLDVFVDRKNYDRLLSALGNSNDLIVERNSKSTLWVDRVRLRNSKREPSSFIPTLDVLVLDPVPSSAFLRRMKLFLILALQGMMKSKLRCSKGGIEYRVGSVITYVIGLLFPYRLKAEWYRRVSRMGELEKSEYLANYNGEFADLWREYPSDMMDCIEEHVFEDGVAFITSKFDICLKMQFGDYMTPPKEDDRKPRHGALKNKK